jgi:hypothetical protein
MSKLISQNENGVIYVESDNDEIFGIIDSLKITDHDGIVFSDSTLRVLEDAGFQLNQDWENETTYIDFSHSNGEISRLAFSNNNVEIIDIITITGFMKTEEEVITHLETMKSLLK